MSFLATPAAFVRKDLLEEASYKLNFLLGLGSIFLTLLFLTLFSDFVGSAIAERVDDYGGDYFAFVVLGIVMHTLLGAALQQLSRKIRQAQTLGTLEALLATRTSLATILCCLPLYSLMLTSLRVAGYLVFGALLFGLELRWSAWPEALAVLLLAVCAFGCLGLLVAGLTMAFKRTEPINLVILGLSLFLGGIYYPLTVLPEWLRGPSHVLPITPALRGLRVALLEGGGWSGVLPYLGLLAAFVAVMLPTGAAVFRWGLRRAMRDGTLTQY